MPGTMPEVMYHAKGRQALALRVSTQHLPSLNVAAAQQAATADGSNHIAMPHQNPCVGAGHVRLVIAQASGLIQHHSLWNRRPC